MKGWLLSRSRKLMRVTTYLTVVTAAGVALVARAGYGRAQGAAMHLGEELLRLADAGTPGETYRLDINGQPVSVSSAQTDRPYRWVLDHFQTACKERANRLPEELAHLRTALRDEAPPAAPGYPGAGILRVEGDEHGVVLCFAQRGPTDEVALLDRLREFAETGDLSKVGDLRYVTARSVEGGAHVVAVWTDGPVDLNGMFPAEGDAPGTDAAGAFRPEGARRLLSAQAAGAPYAIRVYECGLSTEHLLGQYDSAMRDAGWTALTPVSVRLPSARAYSRDGTDLFVTAANDEGRTVLSVVEMPSR